ncbi:MAG: dihydrofolate reductase family protein, partial [Terriglobales bacterium]
RPARPAPARPGHRTRTGARFEVRAAPRGAWTPAATLRLLRHEFGVRRLLHEGGPTLLGEFLAAGAVHEMFLSLAPVVAGRAEGIARPGFAMGTAFLPEHAPHLRLLSAKAHASLLLLRYRVTGSSRY